MRWPIVVCFVVGYLFVCHFYETFTSAFVSSNNNPPSNSYIHISLEDLCVLKSVGDGFFTLSRHFIHIVVGALWNAAVAFLSPLSFCNRKHCLKCSNFEMGFVESSKKSFYIWSEKTTTTTKWNRSCNRNTRTYWKKWDFALVSNRILIGF